VPEKKNNSLSYLDMKKISINELMSEVLNQMLSGDYAHEDLWVNLIKFHMRHPENRGTVEKLLEQCGRGINAGNVNALVVQGLICFHGLDGEKDNKKAIECLELAMKLASTQAMSYRAYMHESGKGGEINYPEAIRLYESAIDLGHAGAMNDRAFMHEDGQGGDKNYPEAIRLYESAIDLGHAGAMSNRAFMHKEGLGGDINYLEAIRLYELAIDLGYASAMHNRAFMHEKGLGGEKNYPEAIRLYESAIDLGNAASIHNRAFMHKEGLGGDINYLEAIRLYEKAFKCGIDLSDNTISNLYTNIDIGSVIEVIWDDLLAGNTFSKSTMEQLQLKGKDILLEKLTDLNSVTGTSLYRLKQVAESSHPIARILNYSSDDKAEHTQEYEKLLKHIELINGQRRTLYSINFDEDSTLHKFFGRRQNSEILEMILNDLQPGNATDTHITMNK